MRLLKKITGFVLAVAAVLSLSGCSGVKPGNIGDVTLKNGDLIAEFTIEGFGVIRAKLFPDIAPNAVDNFVKLVEKGYYDGLKIHRVVPETCIQGGSLNGDGTGGSAAIGDGSFDVEINENARNFYGALGYAHSGDGQNTTQFYIVNNKKIQDLTEYDPAKMREEAEKYTEGAKKAEEEENEVLKAQYEAQAAYYNSLADMFQKASDDVKEKYKTTGGYPFWDGGYTVFGQVFEGFDVLDSISQVKLTTNNAGQVTRPKTDIIISSVKVYEYVEAAPESTSSKKKK
ncbi:MAG: peptidylprolyl isomerase [Oscillospiraceae bacterium]|nr:peptidylprolyl isomerase [Oscillospiraceae bacterium]